eukprot:Hpha_TRINITY_DN5035_c0_g1::TRINITY_DN5035_c0_g1_i1::g.94135::m.94135/K15731/CTDSP; carboxy-terminal domain RNA polymerase II polypeptide A small phosphatase
MMRSLLRRGTGSAGLRCQVLQGRRAKDCGVFERLLLRAEEHLLPGEHDTKRHDSVPHQHMQQACPMSPMLLPPPEEDFRLHVVLDMDETLLHSFFPSRRVRYRPGEGWSPKVTERSHRFDLGEIFYVQVRPGAEELIRWLHARGVEVILWTAGTEGYAAQITDELLPVECLHHRIYRDERWFDDERKSSCFKYLCQLGRPLERCLIVENNPYVCTPNINNALVVHDYFDGDTDHSLSTVKSVIQSVLDGHSSRAVPDAIADHEMLVRRVLPRRNSTEDPDHFTSANPEYFWSVPRAAAG